MGDLSEHFSQSEFDCRCSDPDCSGKGAPDPRLVVGLEWLRALGSEKLGKDTPLTITTSLGKNGGNRCVVQNRKAGGASRSQHLNNRAADICMEGLSQPQLGKLAKQVEPFRNGGIGIGNSIIHVDVRRGKARWTY